MVKSPVLFFDPKIVGLRSLDDTQAGAWFLSFTQGKAGSAAAMVPWLRQSVQHLTAGVVLVADPGKQQKSAKQKNEI